MNALRHPLRPSLRRLGLAGAGLAALTVGLLATPQPAEAFCGFYVAGADAQLFNDATMVVLMRDGQRTVLSMQNDYQGPPEDFALVIPVPVVLQEGDVKTLPADVFAHVDKLAAPRLVEYWEQDPCAARERERRYREEEAKMEDGALAPSPSSSDDLGVKVEAQFVVGEYEVVILSAEDSTGLDTWLKRENYNIPAGAEPVLRPYVEGGMKFFVAKVDVDKVQFTTKPDGSERAMLSPLRFHYDSEEFNLPIRLGLINAQGAQDLLVHILAPEQRYEAANYDNVTIPTNLVVKDQVRERFGEFYVSLFDHTLAQHRAQNQGAPPPVVTEYAWSASSCDPCPDPPLTTEELILLGADVLPRYAQGFDEQGQLDTSSDASWKIGSEMVLTRLHARYDKDTLGEDLVFKAAEGLQGGQGMPDDYELDPEVHTGQVNWNNFQGRYAILHRWAGPVKCLRPLWDTWGGPPPGQQGQDGPAVARELAFAPRDAQLSSFVTRSAHQNLKLAGEPPADEAKPKPSVKPGDDGAEPASDATTNKPKGCACSAGDASPAAPLGLLALFGVGLLGLVRRRPR